MILICIKFSAIFPCLQSRWESGGSEISFSRVYLNENAFEKSTVLVHCKYTLYILYIYMYIRVYVYTWTAMKLTPSIVCVSILLRKMNGKSVEWQPMSLQIYANLFAKNIFLWKSEWEKKNYLNETLHSAHSELFILFSYRSLKNRNIFLHKNVCVCVCVWSILLHHGSCSFI